MVSVLSVCLEEGVSIAAGDRLIRTITPYMKFRTKMTMNRLMKKIRDWSCTPSSMICITMCPECSSENLPGQVFCLNCLRMEKLTRLIKGCSCKDCPGRKLKKKDQSENENENENENESEVFDESRIEEYRSSFVFMLANPILVLVFCTTPLSASLVTWPVRVFYLVSAIQPIRRWR